MVCYALLALLRQQADYGYRLKQRFELSTGNTWQLNIGQIYQALRGLERRGFVRRDESARPSGGPGRYPQRRSFSITPKGVRVLDRWSRRGSGRLRPIRDDLLIWLLTIESGRQDEILARLGSQRCRYGAELALSASYMAPERNGGSWQRGGSFGA